MGRIILVDDDEIVAGLVQDAFFAAGHAIGWLSDGQAALQVIKRRPPDLLILDCNMPGLSGIQLLRVIRETPGLHELPVLMLTARQSENDERIIRYEGANDYMSKPFDATRLVGRAESLMSGVTPWN
ncbi:DNA-binding response OmpR family regulator [Sphingomonas jejuensis]|uniref:DNA-binding response OmpR family regulator n=1 Tax=Sphingomonas jejuensis TaxID=904715 RepID=A0ABX0XP47_9SPHN|nr:DNA-binding response OmpR family regulator [Sphingomonas jejuensis]